MFASNTLISKLKAASARLPSAAVLPVFVFLLLGGVMPDITNAQPSRPRFTKLDMFNPHRPTFECKHEADANPPITSEADALFQQGMAVTSHDLWPDQRNYKKAAELWAQAMKLGHWKAQFNLAGLYLKGWGVPRDVEKAIQLNEDLMTKGVPAAWDNMGTYYMGGVGPVKQDATVAYAFWQRAADMGSMAAQTYIGAKLKADHDEPPIFWNNRLVGLKMMECAFAQGSGRAAYELGLTLDNTDGEYVRALKILHDGVKLGSEQSANGLSVAFDAGKPLVGNRTDQARAERYSILGDALGRNPELKLPNLDKVLPLPPAQLPKWDGNKQTLIDAAKGLVRAPVIKPTPGSDRTGRAHIPDGWLLPQVPVPPRLEALGLDPAAGVQAQYESTVARFSGYWLPQLLHTDRAHHDAWDQSQVPQRYEQGEGFELWRKGLSPHDGRVMWHYVGVPYQRALPGTHPLVAQGIARLTRIPESHLLCKGGVPCPHTGVWFGQIDKDHAQARRYNNWDRQTYLEKGQSFPDPKDLHLDVAASQIEWLWLDNVNEIGFAGFANVTLSDLHDAEGNPIA